MRATPVAVGLLLCTSLLVAPSVVDAQAFTEYSHAPIQPAEPAAEQEQEAGAEAPHEAVKEKAARLTEEAKAKVHTFAQHSDELLEGLAEPPRKGWIVLAIAGLAALISLMWGWTLIQSLLIPVAPVLGLATGATTAFCIIQAFYMSRDPWFRWALLAVGVTLGVGLYLFAALKAKPVAAFLVALSPFMILAAFMFDYNSLLGLVLFCAGFLAGFAAMIEVRPLAIIATSMLGAMAAIGCYGLLSHLLDPRAQFLQDSFAWLVENPLMLVLLWLVVTFVGTNFQFSTGPRGSLAD